MRTLYCVRAATGPNEGKFAAIQWRHDRKEQLTAIPSHGTFPRCKFMADIEAAQQLCDFMNTKRQENTYEVVTFHEQVNVEKREEHTERRLEDI